MANITLDLEFWAHIWADGIYYRGQRPEENKLQGFDFLAKVIEAKLSKIVLKLFQIIRSSLDSMNTYTTFDKTLLPSGNTQKSLVNLSNYSKED